MKHGLLLVNLGTPDAPSFLSVLRYLRTFLSDKDVIDLPAAFRYLLLYAFLLPFRTKKAQHAYQSIWQKEGSPLLLHSLALLKKMQTRLQGQYVVALGMRYGNPSLQEALQKLQDCTHLTVLPLYPQYAKASTGSAISAILSLLSTKNVYPNLRIINSFYQHSGFLEAQATVIKPLLRGVEYVLFSYHGLPQRQLQNVCAQACQGICPDIDMRNQHCYKAQCEATSRQLAARLALSSEAYGTAFQSRLGKAQWIKPYTQEALTILLQKGVKRIAIACPSFVADCLETLEEIGIKATKAWKKAGGEELRLLPCVNAHPAFVEAIVDLL